MTHVRTQMRNAVKARLAGVFGEAHVGDLTRYLFDFQKRNLPFAGVDVSESMSPADNGPQGQRPMQRNLTVGIRIAVDGEAPTALDMLDITAGEIERALVKGVDLGVGRLRDWQCQGTSAVEPQPLEDGVLATAIITFTCSMLTLDAEPDQNLHP